MENYILGRVVIDRIDVDLSLFDMDDFGRQTTCGTVACLAGHTLLAAHYGFRNGCFYYPRGHNLAGRLVIGSISDEADKLLGLESDERYDVGPDGEGLFFWMDNHAALAYFRNLVEQAEQNLA